jgi:carbonic anhydrase
MDHQELIDLIIKENDEFVRTHNNEYFRVHAAAQNPFVTLVACSDSRVGAQAVSKDTINRVFMIKNIGNQIATSEGSIDYGILHLKTPLLIITGHADCGAIKARMKGIDGEPDSICRELRSLPACRSKLSQSLDFETRLLDNIISNINFQVKKALIKYQEQVEKGELTILGAFYDFRNQLGKGFGRLVILSRNGKEEG